MNFLHSEIGSAKDNLKSPIHNWYKFTAGFSHKFVDEIIKLENLQGKTDSLIFDAFAGCGTTLVSSQKAQVKAVGNEGQEFMFDIIKAKLGWKIFESDYCKYLDEITSCVKNEKIDQEEIHSLLTSLYEKETLNTIYLIKKGISKILDKNYQLFFRLALSQTLHKVSIHPIAIPYIVRSKLQKQILDPLSVFVNITLSMLKDLNSYNALDKSSEIFLHDSRTKNENILDKSCTTCITSPPYLNNLDYGEISKVHSHFFDLTKNWADITTKVRKKLVTGSTTHYNEKSFLWDDFKKEEFAVTNKNLINDLYSLYTELNEVCKGRKGHKSFDTLMLLYFSDMYLVLKEIRRVLKNGKTAYIILGDSAPYGVLVPTTEFLGKIALNTGFSSYSITKIRTRGSKWKSLKYRHGLELSENVLIVK